MVEFSQHYGACIDRHVQGTGEELLGIAKAARSDEDPGAMVGVPLFCADLNAAIDLAHRMHGFADDRGALLCSHGRLCLHLGSGTHMASGMRLIQAHAPSRESQRREPLAQRGCLIRLIHHPQFLRHGMQTGDVILGAFWPRTDCKMANFVVVGNAALPLDVAIARNGTLSEQRPDTVGVQDASDASFVIVTAKYARMRSTIRWLVRANQGN